MNNIKRYKKGDYLFKEGENVQTLFIIQSGKVALNVERSGRKIEVVTLGANQVLGEQGLFANTRHTFCAEALQETKVMEVGMEVIKGQMNSSAPGVKLLLKSMVDESKISRKALQAFKMEQDKAPCPQVSIPRVFSLLNLVSRHTGKVQGENPKHIIVDWGILKLYASRMFSESFQRMRGVLDLLKKLGYGDLVIEKNEEGIEELIRAEIFDIQMIEDFAEFYQYNYYKGSRAEVIYVDPLALKVASALCEVAEPVEPDRKGVVSVDFKLLLDELKTKYRIDLKNTHMDSLERKGLFVKRTTLDDGTSFLSFDKMEFKKTTTFWKIIFEIDKWNERGFVNMKEKEEVAEESGEACPDCKGVISSEHKFCPHCGFKIKAA